MPPKWLEAFQTVVGNFRQRVFDRQLNSQRTVPPDIQNIVLQRDATNIPNPQPDAPLTLRELGQNFVIGAEPLPFVNTVSRGMNPREHLPTQMLASIIVPGIPGGPIFKKAADLLGGLRKMPTRELLDLKDLNAKYMFEDVNRQSATAMEVGRDVSTRRSVELDVVNDALDLEILARGRVGDELADRELTTMFHEDLMFNQNRALQPNWMDQRVNNANQRLNQNFSFLELLEDVGVGPTNAEFMGGVSERGMINPAWGRAVFDETIGVQSQLWSALRERNNQQGGGAQ